MGVRLLFFFFGQTHKNDQGTPSHVSYCNLLAKAITFWKFL